ncbi:MAG: hypothetical protein ACJ8FT_10805 [Sphingomonas sp.]
MVTMVDEIFDRHYREGRHELNAAILDYARRFGATVSESSKVLNRIQFSRPWESVEDRAAHH